MDFDRHRLQNIEGEIIGIRALLREIVLRMPDGETVASIAMAMVEEIHTVMLGGLANGVAITSEEEIDAIMASAKVVIDDIAFDIENEEDGD